MDLQSAQKIVSDKIAQYRNDSEHKSNLEKLEQKAKAGSDENHAPTGDVDKNFDTFIQHTHKWKRGVLPNQKYEKHCECGKSELISFQDWQML